MECRSIGQKIKRRGDQLRKADLRVESLDDTIVNSVNISVNRSTAKSTSCNYALLQ